MEKKNPQITIIMTYSLKNKGDEILLRGTIQLLEELLTHPFFYIFSLMPESDEKIFNKKNLKYIIQIPLPFDRVPFHKFFIYNLLILVSLLIYRVTKITRVFNILPEEIRRSIRHILKSDYVIARSTDQLTDSFGTTTFIKNLAQIWYIKLLGKRVLIHSQSIYLNKKDPTTHLLKILLKLMLNNGVVITVREEYSKNFLSSIGISSHVTPVPSIVFARNNVKENKTRNSSYLLVIPRVRFISKDYLKRLSSNLKRGGFRVIVAGQSFESKYGDDDIQAINEITKNTTLQLTVKRQTKLDEYLGLIRNARVVISERAIAVFTALSLGIPSIGIDVYGGKTRAMMKLFDMEKFCVSGDTVDTKTLENLFNKILKNYKEISYKLNNKMDELYTECVESSKNSIREIDNMRG